MNPQQMTDLVKLHLAAFTDRNWNDYRNTMLPDGVYVEPATARRVVGADAVLKALETWTKAFPDLKGTILNLVAQNDLVVAEIRWEGTHKGVLAGPFGEIPPSNVKGTIEAIEVFLFKGNKIAEARHYFDLMSILKQVGVPLPQLVATPV